MFYPPSTSGNTIGIAIMVAILQDRDCVYVCVWMGGGVFIRVHSAPRRSLLALFLTAAHIYYCQLLALAIWFRGWGKGGGG